MAETPKLELVDMQPIIIKLEGPFFSVRVHTRDAQYPEIDLVVQRRFLTPSKMKSLKCWTTSLNRPKIELF